MNTFSRRLSADVPLLTCEVLCWILGKEVTTQDVQMAEHPYFKKMRAELAPKMERKGSVCCVPIQGTLAYNPDPFEMIYDGVEDSRSVLGMLNDCDGDEECEGVLLRMDTPGGMMIGGPEIADAVSKLRMSGKPVVAHAGGVCASLGYMIASQANEVISNRSAVVGSIGVIASVANYTDLLSKMGIRFDVFTNKEAKFKAAGAIGTNLTAEQRDNIQQGVDSAFSVFKSAVTASRPQVKTEAMQGQTYRGSEAQSVGLIDRVGSENYALAVLRGIMSGRKI